MILILYEVNFMKKLILITIITIIFVGFFFIYGIKPNSNINIKEINNLWNIYDINIKKINDYIAPIADANDTFKWYNLKTLNTSDKEYEEYLNSLLILVRNNYINLENPNNIYTEPNLLTKYRNKNYILNSELEILNDNYDLNHKKNSYISKLKYYKEIELNITSQNKNNLLSIIDDSLAFTEKYFIESPQSYSDYLYNQIIETEVLLKISEFINTEYNRLK